MKESSSAEPALFLGIDGGQSHTEALVADRAGRILGRGLGGASNHAEIPGGRERLRAAIIDSVSAALAAAGPFSLEATVFAGAHCGMTGGAVDKREIISEILRAGRLEVGHDAPTALSGATAGAPGVVVIAGTGSAVYGENAAGESARAGGLGYLFSDEGSGFWLAAQTIRLAVKEADGIAPENGLRRLVLDFFGVDELRRITDEFYNGRISRDEIAALARPAQDAARAGHRVLRAEIERGVEVLCRSVESVAGKLGLPAGFPVAGIGGMFRGEFYKDVFTRSLAETVPAARYAEPRFGPAAGALLLAYRRAGIEINEDLLTNLETTQSK